MDKEVTIKYDGEFAYISWDGASTSYLMGMDRCFNYWTILVTDSNSVKIEKKLIERYLSLKVFCLSEKGKCDTNIEIKCLKSYSGITLSFRSKEIYDKYFLYEANHGKYELIAVCEDFQINSDFKEKATYYVEGYVNDKLVGKSLDTVCEFVDVKPSSNLLSIIIPVYNSEVFLSRCIDSILLSTFNDYEIILIDDGSSDDSFNIVDWYTNKYNFIKGVHKKNEGVTASRNKGIEIASFEYLAFVDNDDIIHPYMYEYLYKMVSLNGLDIAIGKTIIRNNPFNYNVCLDVKKDVIYSYDKMFNESVKRTYDNIFFVAVWNKIIRTSLVKKHLFPLESHFEDTAFTKTIYSYIDRFGFSKDAYYVWDKRIRNTSGTASNGYKSIDNYTVNKYYMDALFYCVKNGNINKMDYLIYDTLKEIYDYFTKNNVKIGTSVFNMFLDEIIKTNNKYDILNNKFIAKDSKLDDYFEFLLNFKTE